MENNLCQKTDFFEAQQRYSGFRGQILCSLGGKKIKHPRENLPKIKASRELEPKEDGLILECVQGSIVVCIWWGLCFCFQVWGGVYY